eukprot:SAG31_NODE_2958_length_4852_cov_1.980644_2_plen_36_part_00
MFVFAELLGLCSLIYVVNAASKALKWLTWAIFETI